MTALGLARISNYLFGLAQKSWLPFAVDRHCFNLTYKLVSAFGILTLTILHFVALSIVIQFDHKVVCG
jgi:hypothetical protein